jgi:hypothetical protein
MTVLSKILTAEVFLLEAMALNHGAHGAVYH